MKFNYGICLLTIALLTCNPASNTHNKIVAATPNIIIILSDDMGYADIGCYGGEIKTPVKSSQINPSECLKDE